MVEKKKPMVALGDISLPDETGMQLTRKIRGQFPKTRILIISMHSKIDYIVEAFQAFPRLRSTFHGRPLRADVA